MESNAKPEEIRKTVLMIGRVQTAVVINNPTIHSLVSKMCDTTLEYGLKKIPEPAASELIAAFLSGDPSRAYRNLVEMRSGRSLCDQSGRHRQITVPIDLEKRKSHFSFIYRDFNSSYLNSMVRRLDVCSSYLSGGCVEAALFELRSIDFKKHKNNSLEESPTAAAIAVHLSLIYNVSIQPSLKAQLCAELQRHNYFPVLREFALSKYVHLHIIRLSAFEYFYFVTC